MLIAHLADLHIGFSHLNPKAEDGRNQRLVDFEHACLAAADHIIACQPDVIVIAGDLFHETNLYPAAMSGAVEFIDRLHQTEAPILVIGGNHDEAEGVGRFNALRYMAKHHGINLFLEQTHIDHGDCRFHLVPYRVISRAQRGRGELQPFEFSTVHTNLLVSHGYAKGRGVPDIPEDVETVIPDEWLDDPRFELCMLGHVHHHGEIRDHVFYSGSIERRNFGEVEETPGFFMHTIENGKLTESRSVPITDLACKDTDLPVPRPMLSHSLDTTGMTVEEVDKQVRGWINAAPEASMLRIVLANVGEALDRARLRGEWEKLHLDRGGFHFESQIQTRTVSELMDVEFTAPPADVSKGFIDYCSQQDLGSDRDEVMKLAEDVISEARERVVVTQEGD